MGTFKPIAMRYTQEQFDAIKPKLEKINGVQFKLLTSFSKSEYLINNLGDNEYWISDIPPSGILAHGRKVFEEWDEDKFLEYCGVEVGLPKKWYVKVTDENREILNDWRESVCNNEWKDYIMLDNCRVISEKYDGSYCAYFSDQHLNIEGYQEITTEQFIKYVLKNNKPKETNQMKTKVKATEVLEIHSIACLTWKPKIAEFLKRTDSEQNIEFTKIEVEEMFKAATKEQKPVLERIFGKQEPIKWDEIKTGSKVMLKMTGSIEGNHKCTIDFSRPFDVVFFKSNYAIRSDSNFFFDSSRSRNTFYQDGKYVWFTDKEEIDYITEVIEY